MANWKFNQASGSTTTDSAGSHTATLKGGAVISTEIHP